MTTEWLGRKRNHYWRIRKKKKNTRVCINRGSMSKALTSTVMTKSIAWITMERLRRKTSRNTWMFVLIEDQFPWLLQLYPSSLHLSQRSLRCGSPGSRGYLSGTSLLYESGNDKPQHKSWSPLSVIENWSEEVMVHLLI